MASLALRLCKSHHASIDPNFQLSTSWQADYPIFRGCPAPPDRSPREAWRSSCPTTRSAGTRASTTAADDAIDPVTVYFLRAKWWRRQWLQPGSGLFWIATRAANKWFCLPQCDI